MATIASKTKTKSPPDAVSCCLVDHANARTLMNIFDSVTKSKQDDMVEKVVHAIALHCRLYNQALMEVVLPMANQLKKGGSLGKKLKEKAMESEQCLEAVDKCKKHLDNKEFLEAMQKQKQVDTELMDMAESEVLPAMLEELDAKDLVAAAERMESVKMKAPLTPQAMAYA